MTKPLLCPCCQCPLAPPSGQSTGMHCPRCNAWLDFDPLCLGSCLTCYKAHQAKASDCIKTVSPSKPDGKQAAARKAIRAAAHLEEHPTASPPYAAGE